MHGQHYIKIRRIMLQRALNKRGVGKLNWVSRI